MERLAIFALFLGVAMATFYETHPYERIIMGARSENFDDAEARSHCRRGYLLAKCGCSPEEHCDGSWIKHDEHGDYCAAFNAAHGHGVQAVSYCQELVVYVESEYEDAPSVECPENYKLVNCQLHTYYGQHLTDVYPKRHKHSCKTSKGCSNCKVQARCIRNAHYGIEVRH